MCFGGVRGGARLALQFQRDPQLQVRDFWAPYVRAEISISRERSTILYFGTIAGTAFRPIYRCMLSFSRLFTSNLHVFYSVFLNFCIFPRFGRICRVDLQCSTRASPGRLKMSRHQWFQHEIRFCVNWSHTFF